MHNAFLNIDNKKMSKSLGNFFTVRDISEKYDLQILRFFMLQAHYRSPLNFSEDLMEAAKSSLERILTAYENLKYLAKHAKIKTINIEEEKQIIESNAYRVQFEEAMEDDFNTADAFSSVFELVKFANLYANESSSAVFLNLLMKELNELMDICGIVLEKKEENLEEWVEQLIEERKIARKEKQFQKADEIRDLLLDKGIELEDTREGVKWKKA